MVGTLWASTAKRNYSPRHIKSPESSASYSLSVVSPSLLLVVTVNLVAHSDRYVMFLDRYFPKILIHAEPDAIAKHGRLFPPNLDTPVANRAPDGLDRYYPRELVDLPPVCHHRQF
jgi:hypothetical protein